MSEGTVKSGEETTGLWLWLYSTIYNSATPWPVKEALTILLQYNMEYLSKHLTPKFYDIKYKWKNIFSIPL